LAAAVKSAETYITREEFDKTLGEIKTALGKIVEPVANLGGKET